MGGNRLPEAERANDRARATWEKLAAENPRVLQFQSNLAGALSSMSNLQSTASRIGDAEASLNRALAIREKLAEQNAHDIEFRANLADTLVNLGSLQRDKGQATDAQRSYNRARAIQEELLEQNPSVTPLRASLANTLKLLAWLSATCPDAQFRDGPKAVQWATRACDLTDWKDFSALEILAAAYGESANFDAAAKWQTKATDLAPDDQKDIFRSRLKLYQEKKPYRGPATGP
jgi:tetratricopeptide (TPR) repeat protein